MKATIRIKVNKSRNYQTYGLEREVEVEYDNEEHLKALELKHYEHIKAQVEEMMLRDNNSPVKK